MTELRSIVDMIYRAETNHTGDRAYNTVYGGIPTGLRPPRPLTQMTVGEVLDWQASIRGRTASTAAGAVQVIHPTLNGLVESGAVSRSAMFNGETQDQITMALMERRGLREWQSGGISTETFASRLAMEWASLPVLETTRVQGRIVQPGQAAYGGVGPNRATPRVAPDVVMSTLSGGGARQSEEGFLGGTRAPVTILAEHTPGQQILNVLSAAVGRGFPEGSRIEVTSGHRPGDPRQHGGPGSADFRVILPDGSRARWDHPGWQSTMGYAASMGARGFGLGPQYMGGEHGHIDLGIGNGSGQGVRPGIQVWSDDDGGPSDGGPGAAQFLPMLQAAAADPSAVAGWEQGMSPIRNPWEPRMFRGPGPDTSIDIAPAYTPAAELLSGWGDERRETPGFGPGAPVAAPLGEPTRTYPGGNTSGPQNYQMNYQGRTFNGIGPVLGTERQAWTDAWRGDGIVRHVRNTMDTIQFEHDPSFDPITYAVDSGMGDHWQYFSSARSLDHYNVMLRNLERDRFRMQRIDSSPFRVTQFMAEMTSPSSLVSMMAPGGVAVRAGLAGASARQSLRAGAAWGFAAEVPLEGLRASTDPFSTQVDSAFRVGGAALFGGLLAGGLGYTLSRVGRRTLEGRIASDIAASNGVRWTPTEMDLGNGRMGTVRQVSGLGREAPAAAREAGVMVRGREILVDPARIAQRFRQGDMPRGTQSGTELAVRTIAEASAAARLGGAVRDIPMRGQVNAGWASAGEAGSAPMARLDGRRVTLDDQVIADAFNAAGTVRVGPAAGSPKAGKFNPVPIDAGKLASPQHLAAIVRGAAEIAEKAKTPQEFRTRLARLMDRLDSRYNGGGRGAGMRQRIQDIRAAGEEAVSRFRDENDKILNNAVLEQLARMQDSPFKRIHRNGLSPEVRKLVDRLAADGAFLTRNNALGKTNGASVYSRVQTWNGINARMKERRDDLFERYLGFDKNPRIGGVRTNVAFKRTRASGEKAITPDEFNKRAVHSYITGQKDDIPEVMEFVEVIRGAYDEFRYAAEEYGALSNRAFLQERITNLRERQLREMRNRTPNQNHLASLGEQIDRLEGELRMMGQEPRTDYFTRVWRRSAILENREFFKEQIVMPWMRQNNLVHVWEEGKETIQLRLDEMVENGATASRIKEMRDALARAPDRGEWRQVALETTQEALNKRADDMLEQILEEAEPENLNILREPNRPTFGRHRQFNIPNTHLLKDGQMGNAVDDFIETDPFLVMQVYTDRMAPAIELGRTFGRPIDGVNGWRGFQEALDHAKLVEQQAYAQRQATLQTFTERMLRQARRRASKAPPPGQFGGMFWKRWALHPSMKAAAKHVADHPDFPAVARRLHELGFQDMEKIAQGTFKGVFRDGEHVVRVLDPGYKPQARANATALKMFHGGIPMYRDHPLVAKPLAVEQIGGLYVEIMPVMKTRNISAQDVAELAMALERDGLRWIDNHVGNAARDADGNVVVIDGDIEVIGGSRGPTTAMDVRRVMNQDTLYNDLLHEARGADGILRSADLRPMEARGKEIEADVRAQRAQNPWSEPDLLFGDDFPSLASVREGPDLSRGFEEHWAPMERDFMHLRDRVTNRVIRSPDRWDNRAATVMRNWSQLVMMGGAALPAIQEFGMLSARHGLKRMLREVFMEMDDATRAARRASVEEMRAAGAITEVLNGTALARFAETGMDSVQGTNVERWTRTAANKYFLWNGLATVADRLKELDAGIRVHDMTARIDRVARSSSPDVGDLEELARWGISRETAQRMADQPIYRSQEGHWFANTDAWGDEDLVRTFRSAIRQGNENTILMATAADKPIIADGTIYLRKSPLVNQYAERAGLPSEGQYWRIQSGLLTLPFSFWNYGFAATNKILLAGLDEPSTRMLVGISVMAGIGYLVNGVRTPEDRWANMSMTDKIGGAIEQSGFLGVLTNYGHLAQTAAIGATGVNPLPFEPRNGFMPSRMDAGLEFMGAGPAVLRNAVQGPLTGDVNQASWAVPFRNHLLLKDMLDGVVDRLEGVD